MNACLFGEGGGETSHFSPLFFTGWWKMRPTKGKEKSLLRNFQTHTLADGCVCSVSAEATHSKEQDSGFEVEIVLLLNFTFAVSFCAIKVKDKQLASQTCKCNVVYTRTHMCAYTCTHTCTHKAMQGLWSAEINLASYNSRGRKLNLPFCHFCGTLFNKNAVCHTFHFPLELWSGRAFRRLSS